MKVGFNARYLYDPGLRGFNRYSLCLLRALQEISGIEMCLVGEGRFPVHKFYRSALRAHVTNLPASRTLFWEQWVLPRYLVRAKVDVFHAPAEGGLPLRKACPYILTYHGVPDRRLASLVRSGELPGSLENYFETQPQTSTRVGGVLRRLRAQLWSHLYLRAADLVITVSEFSKFELVYFLGIRPENVRVIYEGADPCFAQPLPVEYIQHVCVKYRLPSRFVLFVGGFDRRKNVSTLLRAVAALRKGEPDVGLVLVGIGGDIEGCKLQSAALGLKEGQSIFYLHRLPDQELAALYRAACLFTTLSWHEGFCLPLVEAMTCGAPVLASRFGAIPEVLGEGGWLIDPRRLEEVVGAMQTILAHDEVRDEMRRRALSRSKRFSWARAAQETLDVYKESLAGRS